ncbi:transcriptional regulator [Chimaeribacter coloradensis]|uniref:Transcriptional regulator n=1 Tax=Chimaeribacter coloradensis TaxID=2060068 RepID=A0A2N5E0Q3_9GAMM|nr:AlpA family phage regulatory protein [Chimaeribacter coloradensis]PLR33795.1 transcriptional regulator [Chimaeribacter coloradensis]
MNTTNIYPVQSPQPLIRISKMLELLDCSRTTLYRWVQQGDFPQPLKRAGRTLGWQLSVYESWLQNS